MTELSAEDISKYFTDNFADLQPKASWGETSFFVNPGNKFSHGAYFATLKEKDGENDKASNLDREGIYRLNFGPGKKTFENLFGKTPARPAKSGIIEGPWDFTKTNILMPHPIYGWMGWLCVINPTVAVFEEIEPHLQAAYKKSVLNINKRLAKL